MRLSPYLASSALAAMSSRPSLVTAAASGLPRMCTSSLDDVSAAWSRVYRAPPLSSLTHIVALSNVPLLAQVPLDGQLAKSEDDGTDFFVDAPESATLAHITSLAATISEKLKEDKATTATATASLNV